jgi:hypothetical protein
MYMDATAKAVTRALSLLDHSLTRPCMGIRGESGPGQWLDIEMLRAVSTERFWHPFFSRIVGDYAKTNWLEGFKPDIQILGVYLLSNADRWGNRVLFEIQYNDQGNRAVFGMSGKRFAEIIAKSDDEAFSESDTMVAFELFWAHDDDFECYMD